MPTTVPSNRRRVHCPSCSSARTLSATRILKQPAHGSMCRPATTVPWAARISASSAKSLPSQLRTRQAPEHIAALHLATVADNSAHGRPQATDRRHGPERQLALDDLVEFFNR